MFRLDTTALPDTWNQLRFSPVPDPYIAIRMQSPDGNQLWCPSQSLWSLIAEHVSESELPAIRTALGHSLVDMYTEVHSEVEMWHKMWQESQLGTSRSRARTPLARLADPPAVKELVRAEVKMLLQTLRERASMGGRDGEELLFRYKPETVDYALSHRDSLYRKCTSPGDTDNGSRPSSCCSVQSKSEDEIEAMRDKLNVADIDQVVDCLKSVLMEECEALKGLVKHLKENIKQKCRSRCEFDESEPSLAELRELRGAVQMDLELYPSSLAASPSASPPLPLRGLKNRFSLSAGPRISDETPGALSATSVLRPHPPPPLCHPKPRPPSGAPPSKTSAPIKQINSSSLSRTHGQHIRSTSASTGPRKIQTPTCTGIAVKTTPHRGLSPDQDCPSLQTKAPRNSHILETHPSSHRSLSGERDLSPQTDSAWRSRHVDIIPSSPHCDAGGYSSDSTDQSGKSKAHNGRQNSAIGGSLVSTTVQTDNNRRTSTSEGFHSCLTQQQSLVATCRINGQFFTSPKRPPEGITNQPKSVQEAHTQLESINRFYQPVPPSRVSS